MSQGICITGKLGRPRGDIIQFIERSSHYHFDNKVSPSTSYLVVADPNSGSTKLEHARRYGTRIISERELYAMI